MSISWPDYLWIYSYLINNYIEIIVNAHIFVTNNTEKSHVPLPQFSLMVACCKTILQCNNLGTDIYPISQFRFSCCNCAVCVCVLCCVFNTYTLLILIHQRACVSTTSVQTQRSSITAGSLTFPFTQILPSPNISLTPGNHQSVLHS